MALFFNIFKTTHKMILLGVYWFIEANGNRHLYWFYQN